MNEAKISKLENALAEAKKEFGDITLKDAHQIVNYAAGCLERKVTQSNFSFSKPMAKFLLELAGRIRTEAEDALGPQPGYGPRKTIPKTSQAEK